jgi:murein DD-endopeptidase MepM/ murein hydrolase activator NlpD
MLTALLLVAALLPPVTGPLTRPFAPPPAPYAAGHRGVDLAAREGAEVRAILGGVVRFAGTVAGVGWVSVDHGGGLVTSYGPLEPRLVASGRRVAAGAVLGLVAPGAAHVDWGARLHGAYIDPLTLLEPWEPYLVA